MNDILEFYKRLNETKNRELLTTIFARSGLAPFVSTMQHHAPSTQ